jgi:MFS family permease
MPDQTNREARFGGQLPQRPLDIEPGGFTPVTPEAAISEWLEELETSNHTQPKDLSNREITPAARIQAEPAVTTREFGFFNYVWISVFWLGITYLWGGVNGVILPKLNEQMVPENYKGSLLGIITALGMVVAIIVQPTIGALSDVSRHHWGRRRPFILVGGTMVVVALGAMAFMAVFARQWWLLLVCYLLLQLADNVAQGAYQGFIPDSVPNGRRGRASGAMGIAQLLGNVAGVAGATFFIDRNQPALAIMVVILVFTSTLIPTLFLVKETPLKGAAPARRWNVVRGTLKEFLQHRDFVRFIISRLFVLTAIATISLFALYFLQDVIGAKEGTLTSSYTVVLLVVVGFSLLSIFPAAWLSDKIGRKKLVIVACVVGIIGTLLMSTATNMTQVMIYASLLGVATGSFNSIDWALATDLIPKGAAGRFMGISNLAGAGSQALAALVGGGLRDGFNALGETFLHQKNVGYSALFIASAIFFILGIFFLLRVKEPLNSNA